MTENFTITLKVAGRVFQLEIRREDEEFFRLAAKRLNALWEAYSKEFQGEEFTTQIIMAALHIGKDFYKEKGKNDIAPIAKWLSDLEEKIDETLEE